MCLVVLVHRSCGGGRGGCTGNGGMSCAGGNACGGDCNDARDGVFFFFFEKTLVKTVTKSVPWSLSQTCENVVVAQSARCGVSVHPGRLCGNCYVQHAKSLIFFVMVQSAHDECLACHPDHHDRHRHNSNGKQITRV